MQTGKDGIEVMHYFEQCKLKAYPDPGSLLFAALKKDGIDPYDIDAVPSGFASLSGRPWTIGWGDTGPGVVPGLTITQDEADRRFRARLANEFEPGVEAMLQLVPTVSQFGAMCALAYNIGLAAFRTSTVLRKFNAGDMAGAQAAFLLWNKSGGRQMKGLDRRRWAESKVFAGWSASTAIADALKQYP